MKNLIKRIQRMNYIEGLYAGVAIAFTTVIVFLIGTLIYLQGCTQ